MSKEFIWNGEDPNSPVDKELESIAKDISYNMRPDVKADIDVDLEKIKELMLSENQESLIGVSMLDNSSVGLRVKMMSVIQILSGHVIFDLSPSQEELLNQLYPETKNSNRSHIPYDPYQY